MVRAGAGPGRGTSSYEEVASSASHRAHDGRKALGKVEWERSGYLETTETEEKRKKKATRWAFLKRMGNGVGLWTAVLNSSLYGTDWRDPCAATATAKKPIHRATR
jgi:hypothetical protein